MHFTPLIRKHRCLTRTFRTDISNQ